MVTLKTPRELRIMREAGRVVAHTLQTVAAAAKPGATLTELDALAAETIRSAGAKPSFLHYQPWSAAVPYPAVLCLSVNDVIDHGVPTDRALQTGDILSIDCGAEIDGYHGDAAVTVPVVAADDAAIRLMAATEEALHAGIAAAVVGGRLGDISYAVEQVGRRERYGILEGFGGHGIGTAMHEDPHIPNTGRRGRGMPLRDGLVLAIEPMFIEGGSDAGRILPDGWSIATADGSRGAHFEHTVAVTADGPMILTAL